MFYVFYIALRRDETGPALFRFGTSGNIDQTLSRRRKEFPEAQEYGIVDAGPNKTAALNVCNLLKREFADRRTTDGWFRFDVTSAVDKQQINEACRQFFLLLPGKPQKWERIPALRIDKTAKQRAAAYVSAVRGRKY